MMIGNSKRKTPLHDSPMHVVIIIDCRISLSCSTTNSEGSTADELVTDFFAVFQQYDLKKKFITAIVTDTEPTMNCFGRKMKEEHKVAWVGCIDHILELASGKAFDDSKYDKNAGCMKACRQLVGEFRHSNQKLVKLKDMQKSDTSSPLILIEDCETRWWSTFTMLERLVRLKKYLVAMETIGDLTKCLTNEQWAVAEDIVHVLQPFMLAQEFFEGEKYVTISTVCLLIEKIREQLRNTLQSGRGSGVNTIVKEVVSSFEASWGNGLAPVTEHETLGPRQRVKGFQPVHLIAAVLDPRSTNKTSQNVQ